ncbi:MAG: hypothetical protein WD358_04895 [Nitriliruptoraceae bacterium]
MRIVAYDITARVSLMQIGEILVRLDADVVGLNGVQGSRELRGLARAANLEVAAKGAARGSISAVLVKTGVNVRSAERIELATSRGSTSRSAAHAIVGGEGGSLSVSALDFGLRGEVRRRNLELLTGFLAGISPPTIIAASCHESTSGPVVRELAATWHDAFAVAGVGSAETYPASEPVARHDFVFVDRRLRVAQCMVDGAFPVSEAAKHRPVVVEVSRVPAQVLGETRASATDGAGDASSTIRR